MFVTVPECMPWAVKDAMECTCNDGLAECPNPSTEKTSPLWTGYVCDVQSSPAASQKSRTGRYKPKISLTKSDDMIDPEDAFYEVPYDEDHGKDVVVSWPTPLGKTEEQVRGHCLDKLQGSLVYSKCQEKFDEEWIITNCVLDIQITDDYMWSNSYQDGMEATCINTLIVESNATSIEELEDDPIYSDVVDNVCPANCNEQGTCKEGACICDEGFAGPDCGVSKSLPPNLVAIEKDGSCDLTLRICGKVQVLSTNMFGSDDLICRFSTYQLLPENSEVHRNDVMVTRGLLKNYAEVECPLPTSKLGASSGYKLALSNGGILFSNELQLVVHDPTCLELKDGTWTQKMSTCFLNERCFADEQRRDDTTCVVCTSGKLINDWTDAAKWGEWSTCSRSCDFGVEGRDFGCDGLTLERNTRTCNLEPCPPKQEEFLEGVVMHLSDPSVQRVLDESDLFLELIASAVNSYCTEHPTECCVNFGPANMDLAKKIDITSVSQTYFGSGYPEQVFNVFRTKVLVRAAVSDMELLCGAPPRAQRSAEDDLFIDITALYNAVLADQLHIETVLGITISYVEYPVYP